MSSRAAWVAVLASIFAAGLGAAALQQKPAAADRTQRREATEAELRQRASQAREAREKQRRAGAPEELIPDYIRASIGPVPASLGVDPFYRKYVDANGIPVLSSDKVPDAALLVMRDIVTTMLAARSDLRRSMIEHRWRTGVIAELEMTADIPEYANRKRPGAPPGEPVNQLDRDYHARRSRGLGGNPTTGAEENLLGYPGTRYYGEHIFVHEFSHAIMTAVRRVDPAMHAEIVSAYDAAKAAGKYVGANGRTTTRSPTRTSTGPKARSGGSSPTTASASRGT